MKVFRNNNGRKLAGILLATMAMMVAMGVGTGYAHADSAPRSRRR